MHRVTLPPSILRRLESRLHADLSSVLIRVSHCPTASGALAYTRGETIVFAPGQYDPYSHAGFGRLVHEMTHVLQQRAGRTPSADEFGQGLFVDPTLEEEAQENAKWACRAPRPSLRAPGWSSRPASPGHAAARPRAAGGDVAQPILGYHIADSVRDFGGYVGNGFWNSGQYIRDGINGVLGYAGSAVGGFGGYVVGAGYGAGAYLAAGPAYVWRGVAGAAAFGWRGAVGTARHFGGGRAGRTWTQYLRAGAFDAARYLADGVRGTRQYVNDGLGALARGAVGSAQYGLQGVMQAGAFGWNGARQATAYAGRGLQGAADFLGRGMRAGRRELGYFRLGALGMGAAAAAAAVYGLPLSTLVPLVRSFAPNVFVAAAEQMTPPVVAAAVQALGGVLAGHPVLASALVGASIPYAVDLMHFYRMRYLYTPERAGYHTLARHSAWHTRWNMARRLVAINASTRLSTMQDWSGQYVPENPTSSQFRSESWHAYSIERANEQLLLLQPGANILELRPDRQLGATEAFTIEYPGWDVGLSHTAAGTQVVDRVYSNFIERRAPGGGPTGDWFLVQHYPRTAPAPNNYQRFVPWYRYFL